MSGLSSNSSSRALGDPRFLDERTAHWAEAKPDDEAFTYLDRTWTWSQWNDRVRRLAGACHGNIAVRVMPATAVLWFILSYRRRYTRAWRAGTSTTS